VDLKQRLNSAKKAQRELKDGNEKSPSKDYLTKLMTQIWPNNADKVNSFLTWNPAPKDIIT